VGKRNGKEQLCKKKMNKAKRLAAGEGRRKEENGSSTIKMQRVQRVTLPRSSREEGMPRSQWSVIRGKGNAQDHRCKKNGIAKSYFRKKEEQVETDHATRERK